MIIECASCPTLTRPARAKTADYNFPTTVRVGDQCEKCYRRGTPPRARHDHAYNLAGLASFLRRRNERAHTQARANYYMERMSNA